MPTTGIVGIVITALCCLTPVSGVLLGAVGLSVLIGLLDVVLIPAMLVFAGITVHALVSRTKTQKREI